MTINLTCCLPSFAAVCELAALGLAGGAGEEGVGDHLNECSSPKASSSS